MAKMNRKFITVSIAILFIVGSTGVYCPFLGYPAQNSALRPQAAAVSDNIKRIRLDKGLDFEVEKLPWVVMQRLAMTKSRGKRIAIIREEARGMTKSQVYKKAGIPSNTYMYIEKSKGIPTPRHLYNIAKALKVDPVWIIDGMKWDEAKKKLKGQERMLRLRLRKGRTQSEMVEELKRAGLTFGTDKVDAQRSTYLNWERGKVKPLYGDKIILAKVLGDDTLFDIPQEYRGDVEIELRIMPGMLTRYKTNFRLAFCWKEIQGCSVEEAAEKMDVSTEALQYFMKRHGREKIVEFYGIDLTKKAAKALKTAKKGRVKKKRPGRFTAEDVAGDLVKDLEYLKEDEFGFRLRLLVDLIKKGKRLDREKLIDSYFNKKTLISDGDVERLCSSLTGLLDFDSDSPSLVRITLAVIDTLTQLPAKYKTLSVAKKILGFLDSKSKYRKAIESTGVKYFESIPDDLVFVFDDKKKWPKKLLREKADKLFLTLSLLRRGILEIPRLTDLGEIKLGVLKEFGDKEAKKHLIACNLRLLNKIASEYYWSGFSISELVSPGYDGLNEAADKWEVQKGVKFVTYAYIWIRGKIGIYTSTTRTWIDIPPVLALQIKALENKCWKKGIDPADADVESSYIAEAIGMEVKEVKRLRGEIFKILSLEERKSIDIGDDTIDIDYWDYLYFEERCKQENINPKDKEISSSEIAEAIDVDIDLVENIRKKIFNIPSSKPVDSEDYVSDSKIDLTDNETAVKTGYIVDNVQLRDLEYLGILKLIIMRAEERLREHWKKKLEKEKQPRKIKNVEQMLDIFWRRFFFRLTGSKLETLEDVGGIFGVSRTTVADIENEGLEELREVIAEFQEIYGQSYLKGLFNFAYENWNPFELLKVLEDAKNEWKEEVKTATRELEVMVKKLMAIKEGPVAIEEKPPAKTIEEKFLAEVKEKGWRILPGIKLSKIHRLLAMNWKDIKGLTIPQVAEKLGIKNIGSLYGFFWRNKDKDAEGFYGVKHSGEEVEISSEEEKDIKFLPGVKRTPIHCFFAKNWKEIDGLCPREIIDKFCDYEIMDKSGKSHKITKSLINGFLRRNKAARGFYNILKGTEVLRKKKAISAQERERQFLAEAERQGLKYMPGVPRRRTAELLGKYWREIKGLTIPQIAKKIVELETDLEPDRIKMNLHRFFRKNKEAAEFYEISMARAGIPRERRPALRAGPALGRRAVPGLEKQKLVYEETPILKRERRLKLVLAEKPGLDSLKKLLAYLDRQAPDILKDIPEDKRKDLLEDFLFFGYEIIPLPEELRKRLPLMTVGQRVAAISEERGMEPKELCARTGISQHIYSKIEKFKDTIHPAYIKNLFEVARILNVDLIFIIRGRSWDEIYPDLKDNEKLLLSRLRRCWTQRDAVIKLEEAGLEFKTDDMHTKENLLSTWEKGVKPKSESRKYIRIVVGDNTLYRQAYELIAAEAESGAPGLAEPEVTAERLSKMVEYVEELFTIVADTKEPYNMGKDGGGLEKLFALEEDKEAPETYFALYFAYDTYKRLRSPEERISVDEDDIEEAIYLLDILAGKYSKIEDKLSKEPLPAELTDIRRLWKVTIYLRQMLKLLAPTKLCDWDNPEIRGLAAELTKYLVEDSDKADRIEDWVRRNIDFALGYGGYWDAPASETMDFSRGFWFNRANLIVAMLRSVGILARYKIMHFKKEMVKDMISPERYKKMAETTEHIVAEAFIDGRWAALAGEVFINDKWVILKELEAEKVGEPEYVYNIDQFALEKSEKDSRRARNKMEDYRIKDLVPLYHPDNIVETFRNEEGRISWDKIPAVWLKPDIKALVDELARLRGRVKALVELLYINDFRESVFETDSGGRVSLSGLFDFIREKTGLDTEIGAFYKIMKMVDVEKGSWDREDWHEVKQIVCSHMPDEKARQIKTVKDIEEHLYSHGLKEIEERRLAEMMNGGKGNKAALTALMMADYSHIERYIDKYCKGFPVPLDLDELKYAILRGLSKEFLLFNPEEKRLFAFADDNLMLMIEDYVKISSERRKGRRRQPADVEGGKINPLLQLNASIAVSQSA